MASKYYKKKEDAISKEEKSYQEALELVASVDCVLRFEWRVKSLEDAAKIFHSLGEYKDAGEQAGICEREAEEALRSGYEETYRSALLKQGQAEKKSDYIDAISEFKRVLKSEKHEAEARERITACKKKILQLETRAVWKKRGIAFVVLCALALALYFSPAYPFVLKFIKFIR